MDFQVLDKGFVRLESSMGGDAAVVRAARVSYGKTVPESEKDRKLIEYLLKHEHGTPFEHAVFTFHVKIPIFVARQWIRHRMSSYNEISGRYTEMKDEFYVPDVYRAQHATNKQGSVDADLHHEGAKQVVQEFSEKSYLEYQKLLRLGVAREMARMVLPVNFYTEWYWTVNARSLMHFIRLRSEDHAQWEIRQYSDVLAKIFHEVMPWTSEAFVQTLKLENYPVLKSLFATV